MFTEIHTSLLHWSEFMKSLQTQSLPALSFSMSGDKEVINSPYKYHLTRIKSSNARYRTALNSVVRWKNINRTSRTSCKTIGASSVIMLLPNFSCCPSLPVKRKNPSTLRYLRHPSKLQNGSCCTTDYLWMLKMVVFSNCFLFGGSQDEI